MEDAVTLDPMRRRVRKFTPGRKRAFVELLAAGHSPTGAAKAVGLSRQAAYSQRAADPGFAEAWSEALERQADLYEDALRRAAIDQKNIGGIIFGLKNLRPDRWKDRHETVVESRSVSLNVTAQPVREFHLLERVLEELRLRRLFPCTGQLVLVEDPKIHGPILSGHSSAGRTDLRNAGSGGSGAVRARTRRTGCRFP